MDYEKILSPTVVGMKPSGIRKFFDIANTMQGVISLGVGEPDFPTPWEIRKAGILSLESGKTRYTSNWGLEILRREIANYLNRKYGLEYDPANEILVSVGGSEGIDAAIRALVCPGDEVIIPQPSYVCYEPLVRLAGGVPVILETTAEHDFKVTPEMLRGALTDRTKLLILPYPCNPTGAIMERADLEALAGVLRGTDVMVLSDEIYSLGWVDCTDDGEWTRTGSFSGTSALVKVFPDGETWILITNTSTWKGSRFSRDTGALCKNLRKRFSSELPERNLFSEP